MDELNPDTFDVLDMFNGVAYPKTTVDFYTDQKSAYDLSQLTRAISKAVSSGASESELEKLYAESRELAERTRASKYVFHLTGVSRDDQIAVITGLDRDYPVKVDFLGRREPNVEREEAGTNLIWALHTERIVAPNGSAINAPSAETIKYIRSKAPDSEIEKVEAAISEFRTGSKSGFEAVAQNPDF
jgi:hypothetical protein